MRFQKPIKQGGRGRAKLYAGVDAVVEDRIISLSQQHDCSKSFVANSLLAKMLGVKLEEYFDDYKRTTGKAAKRKRSTR